jgi:NAD(P)-dependent dehydrogenase (short-subunit alcohol dehydrogenase family)
MRPGLLSGHASFKPDIMGTIDDDHHPVIHSGRVAVITGAAHGIGRAAAKELAKLGLKIAIADINEAGLRSVADEIAAIQKTLPPADGEQLLSIPTDVSKMEDVVALRDKVYENWGEVAVLMNNAAVFDVGTSWGNMDAWKKSFDVNVFGVINVQHAFVKAMLHQENQGVVINTGSKQGITNPPGNAAYNAGKAAVKSLTEGLAHELRSQSAQHLTAHLFIPGWTHEAGPSKPAGAWSCEETVLYMLDKVRHGDFYILCPDNEVRKDVDHLRIMWAAGDITEERPALSRWHPTYTSVFEEYVRDGLAALAEQQ